MCEDSNICLICMVVVRIKRVNASKVFRILIYHRNIYIYINIFPQTTNIIILYIHISTLQKYNKKGMENIKKSKLLTEEYKISQMKY